MPGRQRSRLTAHSVGSVAARRGEAENLSLNDGPRHYRRVHGRPQAVFSGDSGCLGLVTLPIPTPTLDVVSTVAISSFAVARVGGKPTAGHVGGNGLACHCRGLTAPAFPPAWQSGAGTLPDSNHHSGLRARLRGDRVESAGNRAMEALGEERARTEYFRKLHEMRGAVILTTSHELRTLITICRGHLEVLEPGADEREVRAVRKTLVNVLSLMARLVEDLTSLERLDDWAQLKMETVSLDDFMSSVAQEIEPILGHHLTLESGAVGARLKADPQRLTQALLNLLRNAAEHAQGNSPVHFRVELDSSSCRFEVADEGGGLTPGEEQVIFETFSTGSSPRAGTGLGLSIVRAVARAHGGDCGVANRPGRGATFWISIPWSTS